MSTADAVIPESADSAQPTAPEGADAAAPVAAATVTEVEVGVRRSVRYGRVVVGFAILGGLVGAIACLFLPIQNNPAVGEYSMAQVAGFTGMIGAGIGLMLGGILAVVLGAVARRRTGSATAELTDVR